MKIIAGYAFLVVILSQAVTAQVVPTTPTKFGKKSTGSTTGSATTTISGGGGATVGLPATRPPTIVRTTTYLSLSDSRQWSRTDGKAVVAKLIAFENIVVEEVKAPGAAAAPSTQAPTLPEKPTVVKDGKVRLLLNGKTPYEVALDALSEADKALVEGVKAAVAAK